MNEQLAAMDVAEDGEQLPPSDVPQEAGTCGSIGTEAAAKRSNEVASGAVGDDAMPVGLHPLAIKAEAATATSSLPRKQSEVGNDLGGMPNEATANSRGTPSIVTRRGLGIHNVSSRLRDFVAAKLNPSWRIRSLEAGGGGDCLFHAVGSGLVCMLAMGGQAAEHVLQVTDRSILLGHKLGLVRHLRHLSAVGFDAWAAEELLNFVIAGTLQQASRRWGDGWSLKRMLETNRLGALIGADAVRAIGPAMEGDAGDIVVSYDRSEARPGGADRFEHLDVIPQGEAALTSLRNELKVEYERVGNSHWGTETDVRHLTEALKIGFLIFADGLQHNGTQCLVNLNASSDVAPEYYVCLWWDDPVHFRLCDLQIGGEGGAWQCVFRGSDMPSELMRHYKECNPTRGHLM